MKMNITTALDRIAGSNAATSYKQKLYATA